jgi:hypothetical protein
MRSVWCLSGPWARRLPIGLFALALLGLVLPSGALAQSSVGQAANAAIGRSLEDAVQQNQNDLLNGGRSGSSSSVAGIGFGANPTGRLRFSDHDKTRVPGPPDFNNPNFSWKTEEASAFANVVTTVPGTVLGGQVKVSTFAGYNHLSLDIKNNATFQLDPAQSGSAENDSFLMGASALWSKGNTYALLTAVGLLGQTTLNDSIDDCLNPNTCAFQKYKFDTVGFIGTATVGQVFPLSAASTGPMLDLRGSLNYTANIGDSFFNVHVYDPGGVKQTYKFFTWTATGSATLFANIAMPNAALLRPYLQAYVRQEFGYSNKLSIDDHGTFDTNHYDQAHTYGGVDLGATYALGNMTLGASIYYDGSADERTVGGRLGASWKLN